MKRLMLSALTAAAFAVPAAALDLDTMSPTERAAFRAEVRAYLLENPEVIMEAVAVLEQRDAMAQAAADADMIKASQNALFADGFSWTGGNPDGDITLVEFMDYRCGYCRRAAPEVHDLLTQDGNIKLIIKEFPILGEQSETSARFAIATQQIAGEDAYKDVHDALIAFSGDVNETTLRRMSDSLGFDTDAILDHMESDEVSQVIAANHALGQQLGISGTPSFVMADRMLRGYLPLDAMQNLAEEIRTQ